MFEKEELGIDVFGDFQLCLLVIDFDVVVLVNKIICMQIMVVDVIYFWVILVFGVKMDGVFGCLNEIWFKVMKEGMFYG